MPTYDQSVSDYIKQKNTLQSLNIDKNVINPLKSRIIRPYSFYNPRYKLLRNIIRNGLENRSRSFQQSIVAGAVGVSQFLNGFGTSARFITLNKIIYSNNLVFISDRNYFTIRSYNTITNEVSTTAGQNGVSGSTDGPALSSTFDYINDITIDSPNNIIYVTTNSGIRRVNLNTNTVSTLSVSYTPTAGTIWAMTYLNGFLYAITTNNVIYKINLTSLSATVIAGSYGVSGNADGIGTAATFTFAFESRIISDNSNTLYVFVANSVIRKVDLTTNNVTTINVSLGKFYESSITYSSSDNSLYYYNYESVTPDVTSAIIKLNLSTNAETVVVKHDYDSIASIAVVSPELIYGAVSNAISMIKFV